MSVFKVNIAVQENEVNKRRDKNWTVTLFCVNLFDWTSKIACIIFFYLGEATYHRTVWSNSTEIVTAKCDLITESNIYLWHIKCHIRCCNIIIIFKHVLERRKSFGLLGDLQKYQKDSLTILNRSSSYSCFILFVYSANLKRFLYKTV